MKNCHRNERIFYRRNKNWLSDVASNMRITQRERSSALENGIRLELYWMHCYVVTCPTKYV